jgi:hypothetical protein
MCHKGGTEVAVGRSSDASREEAADPALGMGRIRWSDSPADVRQEYPGSMWVPGGKGVDPLTGEPAKRGVMVSGFQTIDGVVFGGFAEFVDERLEAIRVVAGAERVPRSVVAALCSRLGIDVDLPERGPVQLTRDLDAFRVDVSYGAKGEAMVLGVSRVSSAPPGKGRGKRRR